MKNPKNKNKNENLQKNVGIPKYLKIVAKNMFIP